MRKLEDIYNNQIRRYEDVKAFAVDSKNRINEIYNEIVTNAANDSDIEANTTSLTGKWNLWVFLFAFGHWLHEVIWVLFKAELDDAATYAQSHTVAWYRQKVLEYQHGDSVTVVNGAVTYSPIDASNRIIEAASVKETANGSLVIKAAKDDGNGALEALSSAELTGLEAYVDRFQDAGVVISVVSQNADVLRLEGTVYFDPAIQTQDDFEDAFNEAIKAYLRNLTFDGKFRRIKLIDQLQQIDAFRDIDIDVLQASVAYVGSPNFVDIDLEYNSVAGYMEIDGNYPFSSTITFEPYV